jgi:hypothetical protein
VGSEDSEGNASARFAFSSRERRGTQAMSNDKLRDLERPQRRMSSEGWIATLVVFALFAGFVVYSALQRNDGNGSAGNPTPPIHRVTSGNGG